MRDGPYVHNLYVIVRLCFVVCSAIITTVDNIKFPRSLHDVRDVRFDFYNIAQFPNCAGAVDVDQGYEWATGKVFVCRKNIHAVNNQAVSDYKTRCAWVIFHSLRLYLFEYLCFYKRNKKVKTYKYMYLWSYRSKTLVFSKWKFNWN